MNCPKCGSNHLATRRNPKNPHAFDLFCTECGAWVKFANADDRRIYPVEVPSPLNDLGLTVVTSPHDITANDYQKAAMRTAGEYKSDYDMMRNAAYGMNGEAGEVIDILKKHEFQGHRLDREALLDETSDVLWYVALMASALGVSLGDIAKHNVDKLRARYPKGFDPERSINRSEYEEDKHENH